MSPAGFPVIPGFRIEEEIGRGTSARVFRARQENLNRPVALKVIPTLGEHGNRRALRLFREARLTGALDHPGIVRAIDAGDRDDLCWFAMELVEGRTLQQMLDEGGPWPWRRAVTLGLEILDALDHAHRRGVVHRDLKPSNILVDSDGHARLLDLGLARREADPRLTHEGGTVGTPKYMAPEQAMDPGKVDGRADLFALGAVLYRTMSGVAPFEGETVAAVLTRLLYDEPTPLSMLQPDLPEAVSLVIGKVLEKDPAHRFPDAGAFAEALKEAARGRRPRALSAPRRRTWTLIAAGGTLALLVAAVLAWRLGRPERRPDERGAAPRVEAAAPSRVSDFVPPARPDLQPLERARQALAASERDSSPTMSRDLDAALEPLRQDLAVAAAQHAFAARGVLLTSGAGPARETMGRLSDRLIADVSTGDDQRPHPGLERLVEAVARDATAKFEAELKTEQLDAASDLQAELDSLLSRPGNERLSPEEQQELVQRTLTDGGILSLEGEDRAKVLRKRDDVLKRLAAMPVEANRRALDVAQDLIREERFRSARAHLKELVDRRGPADATLSISVRPLLDAIEAGERRLVADAEAAVERIARGTHGAIDSAGRRTRAANLAASVDLLRRSQDEVPRLAEPLAFAAEVSRVAAEAASLRDRALERLGAEVPEHPAIDWRVRVRGSLGPRYLSRRDGGKFVVRRDDGAREAWPAEDVAAACVADVLRVLGGASIPVAIALLEYWDGEDDAAASRLKGLPEDPVRNWLLGVVGASMEAALAAYATEAERDAFPVFLEARRRFREKAYARALELAEPLLAQKRLSGTEFLRRHHAEIEAIVSSSRHRVTSEARLRPFGAAAEVKDETGGLVRLSWRFDGGSSVAGLSLPQGHRLDANGLAWPGRTGDRAALPEQSPALRIAMPEATPASPAAIEIELLRSPDPVPFVALSFGGVSLLLVGDLRRGSAFAGVPLHGLERDLVQIQAVQKAVCVMGSLADARRALPHFGRPAGFNRGESTVVRLEIDEHGGVTGSVGDAKIPFSGEKRVFEEPPALDLRLPPGVVVRSLSLELPLVPKKPVER